MQKVSETKHVDTVHKTYITRNEGNKEYQKQRYMKPQLGVSTFPSTPQAPYPYFVILTALPRDPPLIPRLNRLGELSKIHQVPQPSTKTGREIKSSASLQHRQN